MTQIHFPHCFRHLSPLLAALACVIVACDGGPTRSAATATNTNTNTSSATDASEPTLALPPAGDREAASKLLEQARPLVAQNQAAEALALLNQALATDGSLGEAYMLRAVLTMQPGDHRDLGAALMDIRMARVANPSAAELLGAEANVRDQMGQTRPTIDLLQELLVMIEGQPEKQGQWFWAHGVLGRCLLREDLLKDAEHHLMQAEEAGDHNADVALSLAKVFAARGEDEKCERWALEGIQRDPVSSFTHREYQLLLLRTGRKEEAAKEREIQELLRRLT